MLAVPYSRVSGAQQAATGSGLTRQQASPAGYAGARGWRLWEGSYSDPGISAYGGKNLSDGALGQFLADLREGRFGSGPIALLIEDIDRFSRSFPLAVLPVLIDDLLNTGATIAVMGKGRDISRESIRSNPMELHELLFWLGGAHEFSQKLGGRMESVQQAKREQVRSGKPTKAGLAPSWLVLSPAGQWRFTAYAEVIRRVLTMAETHGCTTIAQTLNREGVPSPGAVMRQRWKGSNPQREVRWSAASVRQVIEHPAVIGSRSIVEPGHLQRLRDWQEQCALLRRQGAAELPRRPPRTYEPPQESYYPALITAAEQEQLLSILRQRGTAIPGRSDQIRWIGAGITTCICGAPMGAHGSNLRRGRAGVYLRCKGLSRGLGCRSPMVPLQAAQAHLLTRLTDGSLLQIVRGNDQGGPAKLAAALTEQAIAQVEVERSAAALQAGEAALNGETDAAVVGVLARRQAALEALQVKARQRLAAAQATLQQVQSGPSMEQVSDAVREAITGLLHCFAEERDERPDREAVRNHLLRLGLQITVDAAAGVIGLAVADGPIEWQVLRAGLAAAALERGSTGVLYLGIEPEVSQRLKEALATVPPGMATYVELSDGRRLKVVE